MKQKLYTPKYGLKEIVQEILIMMADTNPGYAPTCDALLNEMNKWGTRAKSRYRGEPKRSDWSRMIHKWWIIWKSREL